MCALYERFTDLYPFCHERFRYGTPQQQVIARYQELLSQGKERGTIPVFMVLDKVLLGTILNNISVYTKVSVDDITAEHVAVYAAEIIDDYKNKRLTRRWGIVPIEPLNG